MRQPPTGEKDPRSRESPGPVQVKTGVLILCDCTGYRILRITRDFPGIPPAGGTTGRCRIMALGGTAHHDPHAFMRCSVTGPRSRRITVAFTPLPSHLQAGCTVMVSTFLYGCARGTK
jgi:hypothetical protein